MKHLFFLSALLILTISANCQLDKKYWIVGGTGSFFSYSDDFTTTGQPTVSGKLNEINLSANVGYFLIDKLAVGIRPGVYSIKSIEPNSASVSTKNIAFFIGPFARYYFLNKDKQFNILVDGTYQFGRNSNFEGNGILKQASIMTGPELFFNSSVGLDFLVGYLYQKKTIDTQSGYINERNGLYMSVGIQIHLTKN